jgi:hypothetical protein
MGSMSICIPVIHPSIHPHSLFYYFFLPVFAVSLDPCHIELLFLFLLYRQPLYFLIAAATVIDGSTYIFHLLNFRDAFFELLVMVEKKESI